MIRRCITWLSALLILSALWAGGLPVAADTVTPQRIPLVTTPEEIPNTVYYYQGNFKVKPSSFTWTEGRNGKNAVVLNGTNQYIRLATAEVKELTAFTFSTWIRWNGNSKEDRVDAQELLTLYRNESYYLSVSPHAQDAAKQLNGIHMQWASADWDPISVFTPAEETSTFALPTDEWHHVTVTASGTNFSLYVDGVRLLHQTMEVDFASFDFRTFKFGAGFDKKPYLNAALQDAVLYTDVLTDEQILLLSQDQDPLSGATATTTTQALATRPSRLTTTSTAAAGKTTLPERVWGLPFGMIVMLGMIVLAVIVLSVIFSIQNTRRPAKEEDNT